jgi:hypothetical protein
MESNFYCNKHSFGSTIHDYCPFCRLDVLTLDLEEHLKIVKNVTCVIGSPLNKSIKNIENMIKKIKGE